MAEPMVTPDQVQGVVNFLWYILLGMIGLGVLIFILIKIYQKLSYNYSVDLYKKVGETEIVFEDKARQVKLAGNYMFHFMNINKFSPVIDSKYLRIKQKKFLGIFSSSKLHFSAYLYGESIFPIAVQDNPGLVPINIDLFNYMQSRLQANQQKYTKVNQLMQLLPYLAVGGVIMMFIVGMIFYTKHIETISMQILGAAKSQADNILTSSGAVQIVKPG